MPLPTWLRAGARRLELPHARSRPISEKYVFGVIFLIAIGHPWEGKSNVEESCACRICSAGGSVAAARAGVRAGPEGRGSGSAGARSAAAKAEFGAGLFRRARVAPARHPALHGDAPG